MICSYCNKKMVEEELSNRIFTVCRNDDCIYYIQNNREKRYAIIEGEEINFVEFKPIAGFS